VCVSNARAAMCCTLYGTECAPAKSSIRLVSCIGADVHMSTKQNRDRVDGCRYVRCGKCLQAYIGACVLKAAGTEGGVVQGHQVILTKQTQRVPSREGGVEVRGRTGVKVEREKRTHFLRNLDKTAIVAQP